MEERYDEKTSDSEHGTRLHKANESGDVSDLEESDVEIVEEIRTQEERLVGEWLAETGDTMDDVTVYRERRMWCDFFSGQADFLAINRIRNSALCIDAKTGRKSVAPPVRNMQLRGLAVLTRLTFNVDAVRTAIIQPMVRSSAACEYNVDHLEKAYSIIVSRLAYCQGSNLPFTAGGHCHFCRALPICGEARKNMSVAISAANMKWSLAKQDEKLRLFKAAKIAKKCAERILELCAIDMSDEATKICGLEKSPDQTPRKVTKPADLAHLMVNTACSADTSMDGRYSMLLEFMKHCKVPISGVIEFYREFVSDSKKDAEKFIADKAADVVETGFRSGSITFKPE